MSTLKNFFNKNNQTKQNADEQREKIAQQMLEKQMEAAKEIANILSSKRKELELTLSQVYSEIRVSTNFLEALEKANLDAFSAKTYYVGYLRSYANFLGLDTKSLLEKANEAYINAKVAYNNPQRDDFTALDVNISDSNIPFLNFLPKSNIGKIATLGGVFLFILGAISMLKISDGDTIQNNVVAIADNQSDDFLLDQKLLKQVDSNTLKKTNLPSQKVKDKNVQQEDDNKIKIYPWPKANFNNHVKLIIKNNSWVRIYDGANQHIYYDKIAKAGEEIKIPNIENLKLSVGNARGVMIKVDRIKYTLSKKKDFLIKNIDLNKKAIEQRFK